MAEIKNIHLLEGKVSEKDITKMEQAAVAHRRINNLTFKIVSVGEELVKKQIHLSVTIQIAQGKNAGGNYFDKKRLIEIVHETFDKFFPGRKVHVHPIEFVEAPANQVDAKWIQQMMLDTETKLKDIAADTGIDYTQLSSLVSGDRPLSQPMKALFWYYFASKRHMAQ